VKITVWIIIASFSCHKETFHTILAGKILRIDNKVMSAYTVGKPDGKRPLGRHKRSWENNIRLDLREIV
jgi:hypothetical protein